MPRLVRFFVLGLVEGATTGATVVMGFSGLILRRGGRLVMGAIVGMVTTDIAGPMHHWGAIPVVAGIGGIVVISGTVSIEGIGLSAESVVHEVSSGGRARIGR